MINKQGFKTLVYTDGCCLENPGGAGGCAAIVEIPDQKKAFELSKGYKSTTNNRMELRAVLIALELIVQKKLDFPVLIFSDSQYVVRAFEDKWIDGWKRKNWMDKGEPRKNADLFKKILHLMHQICPLHWNKIRFQWIKGHNGHTQNERCDELADFATRTSILADDVTEFEEAAIFIDSKKTFSEPEKTIVKIKVSHEDRSGQYCSKIIQDGNTVSVLLNTVSDNTRKGTHVAAFIETISSLRPTQFPVQIQTSSRSMVSFFKNLKTEEYISPEMYRLKDLVHGKDIRVVQYKSNFEEA